MLNLVQIIGRVGRDPEIRTLNSGSRIANLSLASSERWRDKQSGEMKEKTEWHNVVIFNENIVKVAEQYVSKGDLIYISGKMRTRKWEKDGIDRYSTEIVLENFSGELRMLGSKKDKEGDSGDRGQGGGSGRSGGGYGQEYGEDNFRQDARGNRETFSADLDDEIPF